MRRRRSGMVLQHANVIRVVILGKKGVGKSEYLKTLSDLYGVETGPTLLDGDGCSVLHLKCGHVGGCWIRALTVRFMTKRFIGEYDSSSDETWKHMALIDEEHVPLEINDTTGECSEEKLDLYVGCGDIFVIMYSITDEESLEHARYLGESVQRKKPDATENIVLVGTKTDLEHLRRVDFTSAQETANDLQCLFQEISISEGYEQVEKLFQELLRRYSKKSSSHKAPVKSILKKKQKSKDNFSKGSLRKKSMHNSLPILE